MAISSPNSRTELIRINRRLPIVPQVHTTLHHLIVHCVLPSSSLIREKDLSELIRVSRPPIRDALLQLEKEALSTSILNLEHVFPKLVWKKCVRVISFVKPWKVLQSDLLHSMVIPNCTSN